MGWFYEAPSVLPSEHVVGSQSIKEGACAWTPIRAWHGAAHLHSPNHHQLTNLEPTKPQCTVSLSPEANHFGWFNARGPRPRWPQCVCWQHKAEPHPPQHPSAGVWIPAHSNSKSLSFSYFLFTTFQGTKDNAENRKQDSVKIEKP